MKRLQTQDASSLVNSNIATDLYCLLPTLKNYELDKRK